MKVYELAEKLTPLDPEAEILFVFQSLLRDGRCEAAPAEFGGLSGFVDDEGIVSVALTVSSGAPLQPGNISETIRKLRNRIGKTQQAFGELLGVATVTVARWETSRPPQRAWLEKLAQLSEAHQIPEYALAFRAPGAEPQKRPGRPRVQLTAA